MMQNWQQYTTADGILKKIIEVLSDYYSSREARNMGIILLRDLFEIDQKDILTARHLSWDTSNYNRLEEALYRLEEYEPIQHITRRAFFMGFEFKVNASVLIPRPETEELVQWIISDNKNEELKILDIGTGSGCIAISLALKLHHAKVEAWEVDNDALQIAKHNAQMLHAKVELMQRDVLQIQKTDRLYDIIVSNPPYIAQSEKSMMQRNVLDYEPEQALFVRDNEVLIFYEKIADLAKSSLKNGGKLYFEINEHKGREVKKLLEDHGFNQIEVRKDMQGKDRMVRAVK